MAGLSANFHDLDSSAPHLVDNFTTTSRAAVTPDPDRVATPVGGLSGRVSGRLELEPTGRLSDLRGCAITIPQDHPCRFSGVEKIRVRKEFYS